MALDWKVAIVREAHCESDPLDFAYYPPPIQFSFFIQPEKPRIWGTKGGFPALPLLDHRRITKKERSVGSAFLHAECLRGW